MVRQVPLFDVGQLASLVCLYWYGKLCDSRGCGSGCFGYFGWFGLVGCFGCACGSDCCYGGVVVVVAVVVVVVVIGGGVVAVVQSFSIAILATIMAIIRSEVWHIFFSRNGAEIKSNVFQVRYSDRFPQTKVSLAYVVRRHISLDFLGLLVRTPGPVPSALTGSMNFYDVLFKHVLQTTKLLQKLLLCLLAPTCGYSGRSALARGEESLHMMWSKQVYFGCWSEWVVWWWS